MHDENTMLAIHVHVLGVLLEQLCSGGKVQVAAINTEYHFGSSLSSPSQRMWLIKDKK